MKDSKKENTVVLASGVFDLVHYGHIYFLKEAKKAGGESAQLVVVVARDKTVERLKGRPPVLPEEQRRAIVEALKPVDEAIFGREDFEIEEILREIKPDIVAVGYDQTDIEETVRRLISERSLEIKVVRIGRFAPTGLESSSRIKRKISGQG
jgi:FAD synthetase